MHNEEIRNEIRPRASSTSVEMTSFGDVRQPQPGPQESAASSDQEEDSAVTSTSVEFLTPLLKHIPAPKVTVTKICCSSLADC